MSDTTTDIEELDRLMAGDPEYDACCGGNSCRWIGYEKDVLSGDIDYSILEPGDEIPLGYCPQCYDEEGQFAYRFGREPTIQLIASGLFRHTPEKMAECIVAAIKSRCRGERDPLTVLEALAASVKQEIETCVAAKKESRAPAKRRLKKP